MSKDPCFDAVKELLPEDVSDRMISQALKEMRKTGSVDPADIASFQERAAQKISQIKEALDRSRKEAAENIIKTRERMEFYNQPAFKGNPAEALKARLSKTSQKSMGGNNSVERQAAALFDSFANNLVTALDRDGVFQAVVKNRQHHANIYVEIGALQSGTARGTTGDIIAQKAALAIHTVQQETLAKRRAAGLSIKEAEGWIIHRSRDPSRILSAGPDQWMANIKPMLDLRRTFPEGLVDEGQVDDLIKSSYQNITSGKRGSVSSPEGVSDELIKLNQIPANLDRLRNRSRVLIFKSPLDEYRFNQLYGRGDLLDTLFHQLRQASKDIALVNVFGTNPGAAFEADLARIKSTLKNRDEISAFQAQERGLRNLWDEVNGFTAVPGKSTLAKAGASARALTAMSTMGNSALITMGDVPIQALMLKTTTGKNVLEATGEILAAQVKAMNPSIRKEWARRAGQLISDSIGELHLSFGAGEDGGPGMIAKASRTFFKMNLLEQRTFISRAAIARQYAIEFGKLTDSSFEMLDPLAQTQLKRYGVDARLWDVVRKGTEDFEGDRWLSVDAIEKLPIENFKALAEATDQSPERARLNASLAISTMYNDAAMLGTVTPTARERSRIIYGTREDTAMGQVLRLAYQFKGAPMAAWDIFSRVLLNKAPEDVTGVAQALKTGKGDFLSAAQLMVSLTMVGYMVGALKDMAQGKTPASPTDLKTLTEAMTKGGALGLYGDILLGEYDKSYRSLPGDLMGPVVSRAGDGMRLWAKFRNGEAKAGEALNFAISNTPGLNLFYLRGALNYLFLYQLQETLSPGFARRAEKRARENPGLLEDRQRYFIRPTEVVR